MRSLSHCWLLASILALGLTPVPGLAVEPAESNFEADSPAAYVYRKDDKVVYYRGKIFLDAGPQLKAPIILSDLGGNALSVMVAPTALLTANDIVLQNGHEYVFDSNGVLSRSAAFPTMTIGNTLGTELAGTFVDGRALIELGGSFPICTIEEDRYGLRTLTLATNKWEDPRSQSMHLYNGYRISFREDSTIESQMAFVEYNVSGPLTSPPEVYTGPLGNIPGPGQGPYGNTTLPPGTFINSAGIYVDASGNPLGRPVDEPRQLEIKKPEGYSRPALKVIGIIPFTYNGKLGVEKDSKGSAELYQGMVNEAFLSELSKIEGIEVKILELAPEDVSGAYVFAFAKRIGQKYGCDAIVTGEVSTLETAAESRIDAQTKVVGSIKAELVDTTGGRFNWKNSDKVQRFISRHTWEGSSGTFVKALIGTIAGHLVGDMRSKDVFAEATIE